MNGKRNNPGALAVGVAAALLALFAPTAHAQVSLTSVVEMAQQNSAPVRLAQADLARAAARLTQTHDAFVPSVTCGSGLPAFPEIGFTGSLPTIWDCNMQSLVFSWPQVQNIHAARAGIDAAQAALKDAKEQVALDASTAYIELDTVQSELKAAREQEESAGRLVDIEQKRSEAGVDPLSTLLNAQLTAAELKLKRLHLETRAATLSKQLATLTALPAGSITPDHASIPEVPTVSAGEAALPLAGIEASRAAARSHEFLAKADQAHRWLLPEIGFGAQYNRNTTLLNSIGSYFNTPNGVLPANSFSSGFSIKIPIFDDGLRAKAHESAAEALRAKVEAEQAQMQNDVEIATLDGTIRELDAEADVARLKQQIAGEQLKGVLTQLELGNGAGTAPGAPAQLSPSAEQQARIDERQRYQEALDAGFDLSKARLGLLRALGHMQDWLNELHAR